MKIYTRYDVPNCPGIVNNSPSMTQQEFRNEVDIDNIMNRYRITGSLPEHLVLEPGQYGDFTDVPSFMEAQEIILKAEKDFMDLPSNIRKRFNNDPVEFLDFFNNEANVEEAVKLGLCVQKNVQQVNEVLQKDVLINTDKPAE